MESFVEGLEEVEKQIDSLHSLLRGLYLSVFPELETIVGDPITYARVIKHIHHHVDLTDLLLPPATVIVLNLMISSSSYSAIADDSEQVTNLCDQILNLGLEKQNLINSIECTILNIAPNLSSLVGPMIASKLIGTVCGGVLGLANMPSCNLQCLGVIETNKTLMGFSSSSSLYRVGYIRNAEIIQRMTPPPLRLRACRLLAAKSIMAARVDFARTDPFGNNGKRLKEEIVETIQKWQNPYPARIVKPLVVPQFDKPKKKRGGQRLRKAKERYTMTALRTRANRVRFGVPEETSLW